MIKLIIFVGKKVYGRREAFYASLGMCVSFLLIVESHIAKTDALLLATISCYWLRCIVQLLRVISSGD